ncbi:duf250 domain protein membrane protein [Ascodesmis nigricans]|uniref:Duf250 domain protein membrane protein n=1 Tax=Ascodesmis nigricans TaxID=341454 RepID=A0A4S2MNJ7_9PEZI|nr:duf250 domain protein membrane protein [Ascodesmis nigricans]
MAVDDSKDGEATEMMLPVVERPPPRTKAPEPSLSLPPAFYVTVWIIMSGGVIVFNKWILSDREFKFPILLTTWHLVFATIMTQVLARTTTLLDGRHSVKMTGRVYTRAIAPIGFFFSLSLICSNQAYLYLSVAFIQMLKATTPVAVLLATWSMGLEKANMKVLTNVSFIVVGVMLASYGELAFVLTGFIYQALGIIFEATRLVMVQRLLSSAEYKMDPLVSLYYFAPVCAVMNFFMYLVFESGTVTWAHVQHVGVFTLIFNALFAFGLNVAVVFLIGKTSSLVLTLCGVLKDILLVTFSIIYWGTTVTFLQFFGYAIALGGLVYYKLGAEKIIEHVGQVKKRAREEPRVRAMLVGIATVVTVGVLYFAFCDLTAPPVANVVDDAVKGV